MRACWMFMILLSCRLSHATECQSICKDQLKINCVPTNGKVFVPCPELEGTDVTLKLFKDNKVISNHTCNPANNTCQCKPPCPSVGVELYQTTNTSVFMLTGVNANSYGFYRCELIITYLPPLRTKQSTSRILVLVEGHQCQSPSGDQNNGFLWIWILVLVLFGIYSLIVTIIASIIWVKWRRSDSQSDYMNTKPKATRNRKKRGFQNPIPRHF